MKILQDRSALSFMLLLSLRSSFYQQRVPTLLAVLATASGVALATGLEMTSHSAQVTLDRTTAALAGGAELQVSNGDLGVSESLLAPISRVSGVLAAAPFIQTPARTISSLHPQQLIHILGIDLLADPKVHSYAMAGRPIEVRDPLRLMSDPTAVIIATSLARRLGLREGDPLEVLTSKGEHRLTVRGVLAQGGLADAFNGQVAIMDAYALQALLGRQPLLDRIDVVIDRGFEWSEVLDELQRTVDGLATARRSDLPLQSLRDFLAPLHVALIAFAFLGAAGASIVTYSSAAMAVDRRAGEFAALRVTGVGRTRLRWLIVAEVLATSALGSAIGLPLGKVISVGFVASFSSLSSFLNGIEIEPVGVRPITVLVAIIVGVVVGVVGSAAPVMRASAGFPLEVSRGALAPIGAGATGRVAMLCGACVLVALPYLSSPQELPALVRVALTFGGGVMMLMLLASAALAGARDLQKWGRIPPHIQFVGVLTASRPRSAQLTIASIGGVVSGLASIIVVVNSVTTTLDRYLATMYPGAILIFGGFRDAGLEAQPISPETAQIIKGTPGVRLVSEYVGRSILFRGTDVWLNAGSMSAFAETGSLPSVDVDASELAEQLGAGLIGISEAFSKRFDVSPGDSIALETPGGGQSFHIAGTLRDYGTSAGDLFLDIDVFDRHWTRDGADQLAVWPEGTPEAVIEAMEERVGTQELLFVHGDALKRRISANVQPFRGLLYLLAGIGCCLGGVAVMNLLLSAVLERRREFTLMRAVGATRWQVMGIVIGDSLLIGLVSGLLGLVLGLIGALPMLTLLEESQAWVISYVADGWSLALLLCGLALTCALGSLYAGWLARAVLPSDALSQE